MTPAFPSHDEARRTELLRRYGVMDQKPEQAFDDLASLAAQICGTPIGFMSLIDNDRIWLKAAKGMSAVEGDARVTICNHAIQGTDLFVVHDASCDPRFSESPLVTSEPHIRFYAGMPLVMPGGAALGVLGVIDRVPRDLAPEQEAALRALARQVEAQLELRRRVHEAQESEARKSAVMEASLDCIIAIDHESRIIEFNPAAERTFGFSRASVLGRLLAEVIVPPEFRERHQQGLERYLRTGEGPILGARVEISAMRSDESIIPVELSVVRAPQSDPPIFFGFVRNLTEQRKREAVVRAGEAKLRAIFDAEPECVKLLEADGTLREINPAGLQIVEAASLDEVIGHCIFSLVVPEHRDAVRRMVEAAVQGAKTSLEFRMVGLKGSPRWIEMSAVALRDEATGSNQALAVSRDITDRRRAEEQLRASSDRLRSILDSMFAFVGLFSIDGWVLEMNRAPLDAAGLRREEVLGQPFGDTPWFAGLPGSQAQIRDAFARVALGETVRGDIAIRVAQGRRMLLDSTFGPLRDASGNVAQIVGSAVDVTATRQAQEELRESEQRFRQVVENIREVFWIRDSASGRILYVSPGFEDLWGLASESLIQSPSLWISTVHPADRARVEKLVAASLTGGGYDDEYRIVDPKGAIRWVRARTFPVKDKNGVVYRVAGIAEDVTEQKRLEEQFRQAQKMEAIGRLASAVAHDFNNLLSIMAGNASLLATPGTSEAAVKEHAQEIVDAADRATTLTRQLLLFSRKQVMQATDLDLNAVVSNVTRMLQRILGVDIILRAVTGPGLPRIHADPGMIEQALLNLAVNARDAMPGGGRLTISTDLHVVNEKDAAGSPENSAGSYVRLSMSDSGTGIPADILPRIFEPFFTTKEPGKGTGLGLASVYGIVKQHRGWVDVETEPNRGATFRIYFPAVEPVAAPAPPPPLAAPLQGGNETILLVEDEQAVRQMVASALIRSGYKVLQAVSGAAALEVWLCHKDEIDLLLTDMVMPDGVSGPELAERLAAERPDLKIIYTSGYSAELTTSSLSIEEGVNFLQKPYRLRKLTQTVRERLDKD